MDWLSPRVCQDVAVALGMWLQRKGEKSCDRMSERKGAGIGLESSSVFYRGKLTFLLSQGDGRAWLHRDKCIQQLPSGILQVDSV